MNGLFTPHERKILWVLTAVNFVNTLDFMMVMPLGPDFARSLGIPIQNLGLVGGSYTLAAFVAGVLGSFFLDRLPRKQVLIFSLIGLSLGTWLATRATGLTSLVAARVLAGFFGGPVASVTMAMVSDLINPERRGRAIGRVMTSFAIASILGVPAGLELARLGNWSTPFWVVGSLGWIVALAARLWLPPDLAPATTSKPRASGYEWLWSPLVLASFACTSLSLLSSFLVAPNVSGFLQFNVGWPREKLGLLYLAGGGLALFSTRLGGVWNDRFGSFAPISGATLLLVGLVSTVMLPASTPAGMHFWVVPWFAFLMFANNLRWISVSTLASKVPQSHQRVRYMSSLSAIQHLSSASGAILSTKILGPSDGGALVGLSSVAIAFTCLAVLMLPLVFWIDQKLLSQAPLNLGAEAELAAEIQAQVIE